MLVTFKKVLYATDLSANSAHALRYAVSLAQYTGAEVHVLHVVEELPDDARTTLMMYMLDEKQRKDALSSRFGLARDRLDEFLEDFWSSVDEKDRPLREQVKSIEVVESFPAEAILNQAEKTDCDLIVVGGHAQGISHTFLGNVAKRVLRRSRIPVLVVPKTG